MIEAILRHRREWGLHAAVILWLGLVTLLVFSNPIFDLAIARFFWEAGNQPTFFSQTLTFISEGMNRSIPYLVSGMISVTMGVFIASFFHVRWQKFRLPTIFFVLILILGPGLLINVILKEHTGRPRPKHTQPLGGQHEYRSPFQLTGPKAGYSFPCGDSSVGYSLAGFYFLLYRRRFRLALLCLLAAITLGTVIGISRMLLGAHFASDVAWSAIFVFLVIFVLYHFVLNIPARDERYSQTTASVQS
jgi:membrane-associated PAP2 superfamily phosphatase